MIREVSGVLGDDLHGDSCGFTECVLAVSSGPLVVADVSVSLSPRVVCLVMFSLLTLILRL